MMALDLSQGYVANSTAQNGTSQLPIFNVEKVQLAFNLPSDFVAGQVANNVLILALANGRILRIDLDNAEDVDDVDLPKKTSEVGLIRRMFLDPSASHLIITTTLGENFYLHVQSKQAKALSRLKGITIESVAWNPSLPTASTREILIGASDGSVLETYIEPSAEFYRREERYATPVWKAPDGAITGMWVDTFPGKPDMRRILVASHTRLCHWAGKVGGRGREGSASVYQELFQKEAPTAHDDTTAAHTAPSLLAISPEITVNTSDGSSMPRNYAWLYSAGIYSGPLLTSPATSHVGSKMYDESKLHTRSLFPETLSARGGRKMIQDPIISATLTEWHVLALVEGRIVAVNRLSGAVVYDQQVLSPNDGTLGLVADMKKQTYWLFSKHEIFEIAAHEEDRDVWKVMLQKQDYDAALKYARGAMQKDSVGNGIWRLPIEQR